MSCIQKQTNPSIFFFKFVFAFITNAAIVIFLSVIYVKQNKTIENAGHLKWEKADQNFVSTFFY